VLSTIVCNSLLYIGHPRGQANCR